MTNEEILELAIRKAVRNGWVWLEFDKKQTLKIWNIAGCRSAIRRGDYYFVIFSHDFAKAFWGEEIDFHSNKPQWKLAMGQLVLAEDRLKFLEMFL